MPELRTLVVLIPALPLVSAVLTAGLGKWLLKDRSHWPTIIALVLAFVLSVGLVIEVGHQSRSFGPRSAEGGIGYEETFTLWTWAAIPDAQPEPALAERLPDAPEVPANVLPRVPLEIGVTLRADSLTATMLAMVTFISSLVAIYAIGYMHHDPGYWRFYTYVSLFVFSMCMLVSVSNFALLYVFWEAVGVCSYLLIGFWYAKPEAAAAGKKAFLVNRVGDFGFALGIFLIWVTYGTLNFHDDGAVAGVLGQLRLANPELYIGGAVGTAIALLLFVGACGKSAQFPLHVWLPDAMEGPTPVSALIHAATMVTAGVYMVTRCAPLFFASPVALVTVAIVGALTALIAGFIALTQNDLKRVLAYSTISQLGYMFLALGTGSIAGLVAGMFHLFTHAFFKALLFLGAGSVMHAMGGVIDMRHFSGLRRLMPATFLTFLVGCLALSGVAPLSGFWSKDAVLGAVANQVHALEHTLHPGSADTHHLPADEHHPEPVYAWHDLAPQSLRVFYWIYTALFWSALFTAFLTAFYTFRAFFKTFFGPLQVPEEAGHHAHESPPVMTLPLWILAGSTLLVGTFFIASIEQFAEYIRLAPSLDYPPIRLTGLATEFHAEIAIMATLVAAFGIALSAYFYLRHTREIDWLTARLQPLYELSYGKLFFDPIYAVLFVWPLRALAVLSYWFDRMVIDGLVNLVGMIPRFFGSILRLLQPGLVQYYALAMVLGMLVLVATLLRWPLG